ncbi:MAG TPA: hypothetical protein VGB85_01235, partial [Nannocystis sp.]
MFSLLMPACYAGSGGDGEGSSTSTTQSASTSGDATTAPLTTGATDTDDLTTTPTTDALTSSTTDAPTSSTTDALTSSTTSSTTGEPGTTGEPDTSTGSTDTGSDTTDPGTTSGTSTGGGFDPAHIPEIPDDGMPSSAHLKKVPLGTSDASAGYYEYTPPGYGGGELYPLLVFYHGIGENGNGDSELGKVLANGPPKLINSDNWAKDRPFVVLSPQHAGGGCPSASEIHDFFTFAMSHY